MRTFVAVELDESIRRGLSKLQDRLRQFDRAVRWVRPESIHLTIKFLGEVPDQQIADVCAGVDEAATASSGFEISVAGAGCFPPRGPARVVWAGLTEPTGRLAACQQACEQALGRLGFAPEARAFHPHLTLGRVKQASSGPDLRPAIERLADFGGGRQRVVELVLFESQLRREGAIYVPLHRARLTGQP